MLVEFTLTVNCPQLDQVLTAIAGLQASVDQLRKENEMESAATQAALKAAVEALTSEEASEVSRYESIIAILKADPDDPTVTQAITQIQGIVADLKTRAVSGAPSPSPAPIP